MELCVWYSRSGDLKQHAGHILATQQWTDCSFLVGSQRPVELKAHKLLLALASPVFEAMFYGPIAEKGDAPIRVPDVEPDTFQAMLKHIYTDKVVVQPDLNSLSSSYYHSSSFYMDDDADVKCTAESIPAVKDLYLAEQKYLLTRCMKQSISRLCRHTKVDNVCEMYEFGKMIGNNDLIKHCEMVIAHYPSAFFESKSFLEANVDTVAKILSLDMEVPSEVPIIKGLVQYVNAQNTEDENNDKPQDVCLQQQEGNSDGDETKGLNAHSSTSITLSDSILKMKDCEPMTKDATARRFLRQIRFLSMTPEELDEVKSDLEPFLTAEEMRAVATNVTGWDDRPGQSAEDMPQGFSTNRVPRRSLERPKHPCSAFRMWFHSVSVSIYLEENFASDNRRQLKQRGQRMWDDLDEKDKSEWEKIAKKKKKMYEHHLSLYKQKYPHRSELRSDVSQICDCRRCRNRHYGHNLYNSDDSVSTLSVCDEDCQYCQPLSRKRSRDWW